MFSDEMQQSIIMWSESKRCNMISLCLFWDISLKIHNLTFALHPIDLECKRKLRRGESDFEFRDIRIRTSRILFYIKKCQAFRKRKEIASRTTGA